MGKAAFFLFLYLEVLDASFSFDGVIGAFAITSDPIIIAIGLGIGAMFIRSLTVFLVKKGTLSEYVYLEHGALWAIGALAVILLITIEYEVPEVVTGLDRRRVHRRGAAVVDRAQQALGRRARRRARRATRRRSEERRHGDRLHETTERRAGRRRPLAPHRPAAPGGVPRPVSLSKVTLTKAAPTVSLTKHGGAGGVAAGEPELGRPPAGASGFFRKNTSLDLDLGCLYEFADGTQGRRPGAGQRVPRRPTARARC